MTKITPCIWLDNTAEDAANYYVSVFPNSKILDIQKYNVETPSEKPVGSVLTVNFELNGQPFTTLNGGPFFKVSEAISFQIFCKDQKEMDYYYEKLSKNKDAEQCGWVKDQFGVSWQVVPENIQELVKSEAGMKAMLDMKRLYIQKLEAAGKK